MPAQGPSERLDQLEESLAFAERAGEKLRAEVSDLSRVLAETNRRLDALERRLADLARPPEEPDEP